jgi:hypothetical protein
VSDYFGDDDIPFLLAEVGVPVVIAGATFKGIVDYVGKDALGFSSVSGVSGTEITVSVQTSALPVVPNRTALTVDGQSMRLRDQQQVGDGAITHLICERVG